jgi:hypothetical protein
MIPQDSAKFWFPRLVSHPWKWMRDWLPNTVMIDYSEEALADSLRGHHTAEYDRLYYAVEAAIRHEIAGPAFIRTDITSAKHSGRNAYIVDGTDEDGLNHALLTTLAHSQLKTYHGKMKASAIMVRSVIEIQADRTAFHGLPIGKEWRVFADQRGVQCHHGYWPTVALDGHMDDGQPPTENSLGLHWIRTDALDAAKLAAKAMGQFKWSVDFAEDTSGKVWLLDMATAMNSFHTPECPFFQLDNLERL